MTLPIRAAASSRTALVGARLALALLVVVTALVACDVRQPVAQGGAAALARNLALVRVVEVHVEDESVAEPLRRLAALERARSGRDVRVLVQMPGDPDAARVVVGTPRSGRAAALAARAGLVLLPEGGFRVAGLDHLAGEDAARFTLADPERPGLPVTVWLGNDVARLVAQIEDAIPRAAPEFTTWRGGDLAVRGDLLPDGGIVARAIDRIGLTRLDARGATEPVASGAGFEVERAPALDVAFTANTVRQLEAARERASAWTGVAIPPVAVRLLSSVEDLRLGGENDSLGRWNRARPAAEMLVIAGITDGGAAAVRAGLRAALEPAVVPWIEQGASLSAARAWWGRDLERWLAQLVNAGAVPRVAQIVDPRTDARISAHALAPARAALFDHLRATRGDEFVRALWYGTRALDVDEELEQGFAAAVAARAEPLRAEVAHRGAQRRERVLSLLPLAGAAFVESSPDPRRGYGSARAYAAAADMRARGAKTMALEATFLDAHIAEVIAVPRPLAPEVGDVALFTTIALAQNSGMRAALFPSVLASDAGSYSGAWTRNLESDWIEYFERHARAIEHAGFLANLAGADWLGVGSAMRGVSGRGDEERRSRPEEPLWRRDGWRRVIGAARGAFPGALTYGANDVNEAELIVFWSDLDAIGLELDPRAAPASVNPRVDVEALLNHTLLAIAPIAERHDRPVVLTRVTFEPLLPTAGAGDWPTIQIALLSDAIRSATVDRGLDLRATWLWRIGTDPADRGFDDRDPVLLPASDPMLGVFFGAAGQWVRAGSRAGGRSPR